MDLDHGPTSRDPELDLAPSTEPARYLDEDFLVIADARPDREGTRELRLLGVVSLATLFGVAAAVMLLRPAPPTPPATAGPSADQATARLEPRAPAASRVTTATIPAPATPTADASEARPVIARADPPAAGAPKATPEPKLSVAPSRAEATLASHSLPNPRPAEPRSAGVALGDLPAPPELDALPLLDPVEGEADGAESEPTPREEVSSLADEAQQPAYESDPDTDVGDTSSDASDAEAVIPGVPEPEPPDQDAAPPEPVFTEAPGA